MPLNDSESKAFDALENVKSSQELDKAVDKEKSVKMIGMITEKDTPKLPELPVDVLKSRQKTKDVKKVYSQQKVTKYFKPTKSFQQTKGYVQAKITKYFKAFKPLENQNLFSKIRKEIKAGKLSSAVASEATQNKLQENVQMKRHEEEHKAIDKQKAFFGFCNKKQRTEKDLRRW